MSFENPGDDKRCDWCNKPGVPYTYKGLEFSGLCSTDEGKLCPLCRDHYLDQRSPRLEDIPITVIAVRHRPEYADYVRNLRTRSTKHRKG